MSSSTPPPNPSPSVEEQLKLALQREAFEEVLSAGRTNLTALFAVYCWDFILTFPDEYKTMWKGERWTPVRVAFFFNRYYGLLDNIMFMCLFWFKIKPETCKRIHLLEPIVSASVGWTYLPPHMSLKETDGINCSDLCIPVRSKGIPVWNCRRWIAWFFGIFAISAFVLQVWSVIPNRALALPVGLRGCISTKGEKNYIWVYWIPPLLYDTTATIFVTLPLISHKRKSQRTRLITIFARDGVLYFFVIFICNLVNVIYFSVPTVINPVLNAPLSLIFTTMTASRIVLHLRKVAAVINSHEEGHSSGSGAGRRNNAISRFGSHNQPATGWGRETRLQNLGRRIEGGLSINYGCVVVNIETKTEVEKEISSEAKTHDEYHSSEYRVHVAAQNR
ncbi:hypothetical protein BT69DRAFT_1348772 [Atractiella rhizophila]|nr:hypothetical protein BT69DRAFT_1348772 [Atractiella rhizophila]